MARPNKRPNRKVRRQQLSTKQAKRTNVSATPRHRSAPGAGAGRPKTKQAQLVQLLRRPQGATIDDLTKATNWQPHSVRGAIAGALRKGLGLKVVCERIEGGKSIYRIAG